MAENFFRSSEHYARAVSLAYDGLLHRSHYSDHQSYSICLIHYKFVIVQNRDFYPILSDPSHKCYAQLTEAQYNHLRSL